jgi:integrase
MSAFSEAADDYLALRRSLGHDLADAHRLLPRFVAYLDAIGAQTVTIEAALAWSQEPEVDPSTSVAALMAEARSMRWRLPAATHESVIGLLAATGMRVGEAVRLDRGDIDWADGVLMIRESKFGKSRQVPVLPSTLAALGRYADVRDELCQYPTTASFFVSVRDTRVSYPVIQQVFRRLCSAADVGAGSDIRPRIHDYADSRVMPTFSRSCWPTGVKGLKLSA